MALIAVATTPRAKEVEDIDLREGVKCTTIVLITTFRWVGILTRR